MNQDPNGGGSAATEEAAPADGAADAGEESADAGNDLEAGQGAEAPAGAAGEGDAGAEEDAGAGEEAPEDIQALRQEVADLRRWREEQETKAREDKPEPKEEAPREPTPQEWTDIEKRWGFSRVRGEDGGESFNVDPQKMIKETVSAISGMAARLRAEIKAEMGSSVGDIRLDQVMREMATKFPDIGKYGAQIKDYLKRYPAHERSNPKWIEDGLRWARGGNMGQIVRRAQDTSRRNLRVVPAARGGARPAARGGAGGLSANDRALMAAGGFKSEKEYLEWQKADLSKI